MGCARLTLIKLPDSVATIADEDAFFGCLNLKRVCVSEESSNTDVRAALPSPDTALFFIGREEACTYPEDLGPDLPVGQNTTDHGFFLPAAGGMITAAAVVLLLYHVALLVQKRRSSSKLFRDVEFVKANTGMMKELLTFA